MENSNEQIAKTPQVENPSRREFLRKGLRLTKGAISAYVVAQTVPLLQSSTELEKDPQNFRSKQITGLDISSWKKDFGQDMEEFLDNPDNSLNYIVLLGQTHHAPVQVGVEQSNSKGSSEYIASQDGIEKAIRYLAERKGVHYIHAEGVTSESLETYNILRTIKQSVDKQELSVAAIDAVLDHLGRNKMSVYTFPSSLEEALTQSYDELQASLFYAYEPYLKKALTYLEENPNLEVPQYYQDYVKEVQEEMAKISGKKVEIVPAIDYFRQSIIDELDQINQLAAEAGFKDIRSSINAVDRLHMDGVIDIRPAESSQLNSEAVGLIEQIAETRTALIFEPTNKDLAEKLQGLVHQYEEQQEDLVMVRREQEAIKLITSDEMSRDNNIKVAIFGDSHAWKKEVMEYNNQQPNNAFGLFVMGKFKGEA